MKGMKMELDMYILWKEPFAGALEKTCDETDWIVTNYERVWPPACWRARKNNNDSTVQSGFGGFGEMFCYHFGILGHETS